MIQRTLWPVLLKSIQEKPVTLITGARQVGKSTLCKLLNQKEKFAYVSLDNLMERQAAKKDPELFLTLHPWPLIIDEVQYAPELFPVIQSKINEQKFKHGDNQGMYVLTGSQTYALMEGVTESMAGRVRILHLAPLSQREAFNVSAETFSFSSLTKRKPLTMTIPSLYQSMIRGYYPELYEKPNLSTEQFYSDYVDTYINRDISNLLRLNDKLKFQQFMEVLASLTGQELVYETIGKSIGVSKQTITHWISLLVAGDIIFLLQPYHETSTLKRVIKRPKMYFKDTGLAAFLAKINDPINLQKSIYNGRFVETYVVNELLKAYQNVGQIINCYYYRDFNQHEIDLVVVEGNKLNLFEIKAGIQHTLSDTKAFDTLIKQSKLDVGVCGVFSLSPKIYALNKQRIVIPFTYL